MHSDEPIYKRVIVGEIPCLVGERTATGEGHIMSGTADSEFKAIYGRGADNFDTVAGGNVHKKPDCIVDNNGNSVFR